jgi:hypothetical protein
MANTLKFGNGQWATGNGTALAYNDENANFKPLPFDFTRASSGTTVNQSGLIETVGSGIPRIDFQGNTKGALLLEPSRSNLTLYSEDLSNSYWSKQNGSITSNAIASPSGIKNADLFTENTSTSDHAIFDIVSYFVSGTTYTISFFAKSNGRTKLELASANSGTCPTGRFDLEAKTANATNTSFGAKIEDYGNGWFKCSVSRVAPNSGIDLPYYATVINFGTLSYTGDGTSGMYLWGMQAEEGSYATSYIPTSGSAVTRVADACSQTVPDAVIGQTEGTIYFESTINGLQGGDMRFQLSDGSTNNWIFLSPGEATGIGVKARAYINNGNVNQFNSYSEYLSEGKHKYALAFNLNDIAFYVDGVQVALDNSATIPSCDEITLSGNTPTSVNTPHFLSYKDTKLYNTRLSNAELAALTTI